MQHSLWEGPRRVSHLQVEGNLGRAQGGTQLADTPHVQGEVGRQGEGKHRAQGERTEREPGGGMAGEDKAEEGIQLAVPGMRHAAAEVGKVVGVGRAVVEGTPERQVADSRKGLPGAKSHQ